MKENEFLDGVSNIEPDVVERFVSMDNKLQRKANKSKTKALWLRFGAIAACFVLILSAVIVVPMLREGEPGVKTTRQINGYNLVKRDSVWYIDFSDIELENSNVQDDSVGVYIPLPGLDFSTEEDMIRTLLNFSFSETQKERLQYMSTFSEISLPDTGLFETIWNFPGNKEESHVEWYYGNHYYILSDQSYNGDTYKLELTPAGGEEQLKRWYEYPIVTDYYETDKYVEDGIEYLVLQHESFDSIARLYSCSFNSICYYVIERSPSLEMHFENYRHTIVCEKDGVLWNLVVTSPVRLELDFFKGITTSSRDISIYLEDEGNLLD